MEVKNIYYDQNDNGGDGFPLISIIVPVYNTEEYLQRCIDSILGQTYTNFELLLIDDGSTDRSGELCDDYAKKDSRIKVFHKENGGQGSARNYALDILNGQYVAFVDSDDWIESNMYQVLYKNILKYDADISTCRNDTGVDIYKDEIIVFENDNLMNEHLQGHCGTGQSPCDKLYKACLFGKVRFSERRAYEDAATIYRVFSLAKRLVHEEVVLYHYFRRENSTMTQPFSAIKYEVISVYDEMLQFYIEKYPEFTTPVKEKLIGAIEYCVGETMRLGKKNEYQTEIQKAMEIVKKTNCHDLNTRKKLIVSLLKISPRLYGFLYSVTRH